MKNTKLFKKIFEHTLLLLVIAIISVVYIRFTWIRIKEQESEKVMQIARSVAASLPVDDIKALDVSPSDIENPRYRNLKNILMKVISVNNEARFAYLYTEINDKIFFIADSELEDSKDYSPPGQEYTEANPDDRQIFKDGKEIITKEDTDRWGTWVSPLIPIRDPANGKIIAVFGMDFDANQWNNFITYEVIESSVLIVLVLIVLVFFMIIKSKNNVLKNEIAVRKLTEEDINLKNQQLEKINAQKDKFFSIIAHDLRSPFNSFLGFTEILVEELNVMTIDQLQKIAHSLHRSANNLYGLLTNLLEWSKIQGGSTQFNQETIRLAEIFGNTLDLFKETARQKEIELQTQIPENISILADRPMLETIFRNLVSNALKFTMHGGKIIITAKERDAFNKELPAMTMDNAVEISVKDTGIGMSKETLENLFILEKQTNRKGTDDEPSTGLGLLLCKDFIEKNRGKIWVESEEGKGSTINFTLKAGNMQ
ncbi:MAG TPA: HAMP domain-containing sensor histidine kinase [Ignavibacteria bacterium]